MTQTASAWTPQAVAILTEAAAAGMSATDIALLLADHGVIASRNAVIGKIHRMKLDWASANVPGRFPKKKPKAAKNNYVKIARSNLPRSMRTAPVEYPDDMPRAVALVCDSPNPITLDQLRPHHCRAVIDVGGPLYCGNRQGKNWHGDKSSYCTDHHSIYHVRPTKQHRTTKKFGAFIADVTA